MLLLIRWADRDRPLHYFLFTRGLSEELVDLREDLKAPPPSSFLNPPNSLFGLSSRLLLLLAPNSFLGLSSKRSLVRFEPNSRFAPNSLLGLSSRSLYDPNSFFG